MSILIKGVSLQDFKPFCPCMNGDYGDCDVPGIKRCYGLGKDGCPLIPAADVREVVYCKDCKYYRQDAELADAQGFEREWYCPIHRAEFAEDAFCSYGRLDAERRN